VSPDNYQITDVHNQLVIISKCKSKSPPF